MGVLLAALRIALLETRLLVCTFAEWVTLTRCGSPSDRFRLARSGIGGEERSCEGPLTPDTRPSPFAGVMSAGALGFASASRLMSLKTVIFVNRFFYPDHSATSQLLSDLAFDLARRGFCVEVVTSRHHKRCCNGTR